MKKERKELMKKFNEVVEDLLDNYDKYTENERKQIKELFDKAAELNKVLDKYDVKTKKSYMDYLELVHEYFDEFDY